MNKNKTAFGTAGLVLGIIGISLSLIPIINNAAFILGILAFIFGIVALAKKASVAEGVVAVVLGVLAVLFTLVAQQNLTTELNKISSSLSIGGDETDSLLGTSVDVTFGEFTVKKDTYSTNTSLPVTVKNLTADKHSFFIKIEAINENGDRLEDDLLFVDDLLGGQSQTEEAFTYLSDEKLKELKSAAFRVVEISVY